MHAGHVTVLLERPVTVHLHAADGSAVQQPGLVHDMFVGVNLPGIHSLQDTLVVAVLVGDGLTLLVGKIAVGEEVHPGHGVYAGAHLQVVFEAHQPGFAFNNPGGSKI